MTEGEIARYDRLMNAGDRIGGYALTTDQLQALGLVVIAEQLAGLNTNIENLTGELQMVRKRMP